MKLLIVIAFRAIVPIVTQALRRPDFVRINRQRLRQLPKGIRNKDTVVLMGWGLYIVRRLLVAIMLALFE
jgi:hypothetical protein